MNSRFRQGTRLESVQTGDQVVLASVLGTGGESTVFACKKAPRIAVGIPHEMNAEKLNRLHFLQAWRPAIATQKHFAWITDLVQDESGRVVGFTMPKVDGEELATYTSPQTRPTTATYLFLLKVFRSLASGVHGAHASGYCVGDLNEFNVSIRGEEAVILDVVSFSVHHRNCIFNTPVGVGEYLPPELQAAHAAGALGSQQRTVHGDSFSFAIMFWKCLMNGFHPFSSRELIPIEEAIREKQWPHSSVSKLHPKSACPPITNLPTSLAVLFRQCFGVGLDDPLARPLILDWYREIDLVVQEEERASKKRPAAKVAAAQVSNSIGAGTLAAVAVSVAVGVGLLSTSTSFSFVPREKDGKATSQKKLDTPKLWKSIKSFPRQGEDQ
ncbi:MAG: hypothetical protein AAGG48_26675 [Planctomycetota bacterium]